MADPRKFARQCSTAAALLSGVEQVLNLVVVLMELAQSGWHYLLAQELGTVFVLPWNFALIRLRTLWPD